MNLVSEHSKTKDNLKELANKLIPDYGTDGRYLDEYRKDLSNYELYNNVVRTEDYETYLNPLGINIGQVYPEMKPYNRAYQYVDVLLGEELKRSDTLKVITITDKGIRKKNQELKEAYTAYVQKQIEAIIQFQLAKMQGASEEEIAQAREQLQAELTPPDLTINNFLSEIEIFNSKLLKYAIFDQDIYSLKNEGFFHALISDKEIVYVGKRQGKPIIQVMNPLYTFFDKSPNKKYIQDGEWAGSMRIITVGDALHTYANDLPASEKKKLEDRMKMTGRYYGLPSKEMKYHVESTLEHEYLGGNIHPYYLDENDVYGKSYKPTTALYNELIVECHLEIKLQRRVGFLSITQEDGETETMVVDESYTHPDDALEVQFMNRFGTNTKKYEWFEEDGLLYSIEYMFIPDVWEIVRLDRDIFPVIRRKPYQYVNPEDPFDVKLGYYGRRYNATNADSISLMGRMKPYQFLYFYFMFQLGELASRNAGPIKDIDLAQVDPSLGDGDPKAAMEKTLWYYQKGWNLFNSAQNTLGGPTGARPAIDIKNASASQDMVNIMTILDWLERLIGYAAGVSPQRASQFSSNTNVTDNTLAIQQSAHITEKYFNYHNKLWAEIMNGFLNIYKQWAKEYLEKTQDSEHYLQYILPDQTIEAIKLTLDNVSNQDTGVFISASGSDYEYTKTMQDLALTFVQNEQATMADISEVVKARVSGTSPEEVHKKILQMQKQREDREERMIQMQNQQAQEAAKMQQESLREQREFELRMLQTKLEYERETKIAVAQMQSMFNMDINNNQVPDVLEVERLKLENKKLNLEERKMQQDKEIKEKEIEVKKMQARKPAAK